MDIDTQNKVIRYRFELNNGDITEECVPDDIMKIIREQAREEQQQRT